MKAEWIRVYSNFYEIRNKILQICLYYWLALQWHSPANPAPYSWFFNTQTHIDSLIQRICTMRLLKLILINNNTSTDQMKSPVSELQWSYIHYSATLLLQLMITDRWSFRKVIKLFGKSWVIVRRLDSLERWFCFWKSKIKLVF